MPDYNRHSTDAMFSRIMERLDDLKAGQLEGRREIEDIDERVRSLERDRWYQRGIVAAIALGAATFWDWLRSR